MPYPSLSVQIILCGYLWILHIWLISFPVFAGLWSGWWGCYFHWVSILRLWLSGWQSKWLLAQLGIDSSYLLWAFDICVFRFKIVVSMIGKPAIVTLPVYYVTCGSYGGNDWKMVVLAFWFIWCGVLFIMIVCAKVSDVVVSGSFVWPLVFFG